MDKPGIRTNGQSDLQSNCSLVINNSASKSKSCNKITKSLIYEYICVCILQLDRQTNGPRKSLVISFTFTFNFSRSKSLRPSVRYKFLSCHSRKWADFSLQRCPILMNFENMTNWGPLVRWLGYKRCCWVSCFANI